ncbi:MAG: dTDP-4-dehydrorhamnose reductase [Methanobacterium sp. Maddingley MBC34]|nr:MAG: dTDP-4-dehydrorhamnose reductase [Methanobacterium sp. Maddingley MBC34]
MQKILPELEYPSSDEFNLMDFHQMDEYLNKGKYEMMVHAAAFTSPPKVEEDPLQALDVNIIGTANVVKLCAKYDMKIIYICTDYVFKGNDGNYGEEDPVYPVNKYAWSKLGGECAVRLYDNSIIIRTSFGPNVFPYDGAFVDQWTSREDAKTIARKISRLIDSNFKGTIHLGSQRRTVFEYAKSLDNNKDVKELSIEDLSFKAPEDTSLNVDQYKKLFERD